MAGPALPTNRTISNTPAEHAADHNLIHDAIDDLFDPTLNDVNVLDYGAVGNGSTDDTTAIAAAYTAARAVLGTVVFPPNRTYLVSSELNPAGTVTRGYGATLKAKTGSTMFSMLKATTAGFSVYGLTIDMNKANITDTGSTQNGIGCYVGLASGGHAGDFVDLTVINSWGAAVRLESNTTIGAGQYDALNAINTYGSVRNLMADNCQYGVYLYGVRSCRVTGCKITNSERGGVQDDNSFGTVIANNIIDTCGAGVHDAEECGIISQYSRGCRVTGNHVQGCGFAGIVMGGGTVTYVSSREFTITGNTCRLNYYHGISIDTTQIGSPGVSQIVDGTISGNVCNDNASTGQSFGILAHNCDSLSIVGNTCNRNDYAGIRLDGRRIACSGNTCIGNTQYGINLYGDAGTADHGLYSMGVNHCNGNGPGVTRDTYTTAYISDSPVTLRGTGSPEGVYTGGIGSTYTRTDGAAATILYVRATGTPATATGWITVSPAADITFPTAGFAHTFPRYVGTANNAILASGTLYMVAIPLAAGQLVTSITFASSTTALVTGTNQWFALYSSARALLGVTSDDTSTAWAAEAIKTLTLAAAYTVPTSGLYYLGINVTATTVPSLRCSGTSTRISTLPPILAGASTTGLTNPASAPSTAAAIGPTGAVPYAYVS